MNTDIRPVLRVGCLAWFDSMIGVIPCKVTNIAGPGGTPSSLQSVTARATGDRAPYKRGDALNGMGHRFVPRAALKRRRYGARITYYTVESAPEKTT